MVLSVAVVLDMASADLLFVAHKVAVVLDQCTVSESGVSVAELAVGFVAVGFVAAGFAAAVAAEFVAFQLAGAGA